MLNHSLITHKGKSFRSSKTEIAYSGKLGSCMNLQIFHFCQTPTVYCQKPFIFF